MEPARTPIDCLHRVYAPELIPWFEGLIAAWEDGGRASALQYLQDHRGAALKQLKLVQGIGCDAESAVRR